MTDAASQVVDRVPEADSLQLCPPLVLVLRGRALIFRNVQTFGAALAARTALPAAAALPASRATRQLERRLAAILNEALASGADCGPPLAALGAGAFSITHDWRAIVGRLLSLGPGHAPYRRVALTKYLQFLAHVRERAIPVGASADGASLPAAGSRAWALATLDGGPARPAAQRSERLPIGEPVPLWADRSGTLLLDLAGHTFALSFGNGWHLTAPHGTYHPLGHGRSTLGRERGNTIVVPAVFRHVSRRHLALEPQSERCVLVTDLSTQGTYVSRASRRAR